MNSNEFIIWLKGYTEACGDTLTEEQLHDVREKLSQSTPVECPQQLYSPITPIQPFTPTQPYSPPWTIGDPPGTPFWYTSSSMNNLKKEDD
jgi:hypothetical protein